MSLRFIIGGSGSGKTRRLYDELIRDAAAHPEKQYFAIVPEQFTMQTQKDIVDLHPNHGVMNIDIVSFERLAYRIFEELAVPALSVLDDMGKAMVIRRTAAKEDLILFGRQLDKPGFVEELKSQLSEFLQYGITEEKLAAMAEGEKSPMLRAKLSDMLTILRGFRAYTEQEGFIAREELLERLCRVLPKVPSAGDTPGDGGAGDGHSDHGSGGESLPAGRRAGAVLPEPGDGLPDGGLKLPLRGRKRGRCAFKRAALSPV